MSSIKEMWPAQSAKQNTFITDFKSAVNKIHEITSTMSPLYIRCIRPNSSKFPMKIVDSIVEHQAKFMNFVEHVKVRKTGFPIRQKYDTFIFR